MKAITCIIILIFIRFYSFTQCMGGWYENLIIFPALIFLLYCFLSFKKKRTKLTFHSFIILLTISLLLSSISAKKQGQSFFESLIACHIFFSLYIYYFLNKYRLKEKDIINILIRISIIYTAIYTIQQFTYPIYFFYTRGDHIDDMGYFHSVEIRNGIYRFFLLGDQLVILTFFYLVQNFLYYRNKKSLLFALICFIGILETGSRQYTLIPIGIITLYLVFKSKQRIKNLFYLSIIAYCLLHFMSDTLSMTSEQFENKETDSRNATIAYIITDLNKNPLSILIGDGIPYKPNNPFGKKYESLGQMQIVPSDVGILGFLYQRGLIYILVIIIFYILFYKKYFHTLPLYLKMFFTYIVINIMVFPIARFDQAYLIGLFLYLCQINISKKDEQYST